MEPEDKKEEEILIPSNPEFDAEREAQNESVEEEVAPAEDIIEE